MGLIDKLDQGQSNLSAAWSPTAGKATILKNAIKTDTKMHGFPVTPPNDGYSLDGNPNINTQQTDYFRIDHPSKAAAMVGAIPTPSVLDQIPGGNNFGQTFAGSPNGYPGDGEVGPNRYKLTAPEGQGSSVGGL